MSVLSPTCAGFSFTRAFSKSPREVFECFTNLELRKQWFKGPPDGIELSRQLNARVGGHEELKVKWANGMLTHFVCTFHAVQPGERLVYNYDLFIDEKLYSTSLGDVVLKAVGLGTAMIFTEMTTYYGDADVPEQDASRIRGTEHHFDGLVKLVETLTSPE
ncbi:SRPBCC domain-containing protein [Aestuariivirga litoralis]|uniref:SRPBCC domain-containing protein n=1 Tax=Aestuariivirga litoralis TaxID=2650924 RepID=UPI0018C84B60|nr:SRPBCC domain-containing protein [Aestuariivirga litoralis]MBG1233696.1 hypothetical protein [Aestuariivirga litoralis]